MGGLFSSPSPQPVVTYPDPNAAAEEAAREARLAAIDRRRRGRAGTVATSERGLLASAELAGAGLTRKTLLGE